MAVCLWRGPKLELGASNVLSAKILFHRDAATSEKCDIGHLYRIYNRSCFLLLYDSSKSSMSWCLSPWIPIKVFKKLRWLGAIQMYYTGECWAVDHILMETSKYNQMKNISLSLEELFLKSLILYGSLFLK